MGCAKKRINPTVANHVNRNFTAEFTKAVIKAVRYLPPPWKPNNRGRKGHDPQTVAIGCLLKVGFNQTYNGIEAHIKDSETLRQHCPVLPGHSMIQRGMKRLSITYICKVMNRVTRFLVAVRIAHSKMRVHNIIMNSFRDVAFGYLTTIGATR